MKCLIIILLLIAADLQSQALKISRKGEHLGISIEGGVAMTGFSDVNISNFAFSINIDVPMYLTHYQGVWLRVLYNKLSVDTEQSVIKLNLIGTSLRYLWNPSTNSGFFLNIGPTLYFPVATSIQDKQTDIVDDYTLNSEMLFGLGTSLGFNIVKNTDLMFNGGVSFEAIIPEIQSPTIFTMKLFVGFAYRLSHENSQTHFKNKRNKRY